LVVGASWRRPTGVLLCVDEPMEVEMHERVLAVSVVTVEKNRRKS
jgi:hypothetical protein